MIKLTYKTKILLEHFGIFFLLYKIFKLIVSERYFYKNNITLMLVLLCSK